MKKILDFLLDPSPLRTITRAVIARFKLGSYARRAKLGSLGAYSHYGYALYHGAVLAKRLGHDRISVLEFGVAGGNGLLALQRHAADVERELGIHVEVYGFDIAQGLPQPEDYRDVPFYWKTGFFKMDVQKLQARLSRARLVIGDVRETVRTFFDTHQPAPIAAVMFDLDYYSATKAALGIFDGDAQFLLPRVFCYFDDIMGSEQCLISERAGQRGAINEFNSSHEDKVLDELHFLTPSTMPNAKYARLRVLHHFNHPQYNTFIGPERQQQPI